MKQGKLSVSSHSNQCVQNVMGRILLEVYMYMFKCFFLNQIRARTVSGGMLLKVDCFFMQHLHYLAPIPQTCKYYKL